MKSYIMIILLTSLVLVSACSDQNSHVIIVENHDNSETRYIQDMTEIEKVITDFNPIVGAFHRDLLLNNMASKSMRHGFKATRLAQELNVVFPNNAEVKIRLGELSQMGHNMDIQGSSDWAYKSLNEAIQLEPDNIRANVSLARFYVNCGVEQKQAQQLLLKAKQLASPDPLPEADRGLLFVYLQLEQRDKAIIHGQEYLHANPQDKETEKLLDGIRNGDVSSHYIP